MIDEKQLHILLQDGNAYLRCKDDQQATEDGHEIEEQIHRVPNEVIVSALSLQDDELSVK